MDIGQRVKLSRARAQLSQEELARRAGISVSSIRHIEQGGRPDPQFSSLAKIADGLGISIGELLGETGTPKAEAPTSSPERTDEERRTIADSIHDYMGTRVRGYQQEVRDPKSEHFRDSTAATLWLSDLQRERRDLAEWIYREYPVFNDALNVEDLTLKEVALEAIKISGYMPAFTQVIRLAEKRIAEMDAADELATRRLARYRDAADEMVRLANESMAASG